MKIGIGFSCHNDPFAAGADAVLEAKTAVPNPQLAIVFGSVHYDQKRLHSGICSEIDPCILIGGSSYAEISNVGVTKNSVVALLLSIGGAEVDFSHTELKKDASTTGMLLAAPLKSRINNNIHLGLIFGAISPNYNNDTIRSISETLGPLPLFGGMCCGNYDLGMSHPDFSKTCQYAGKKLETNSASLALLNLPEDFIRIGFAFEHGWDAISPVVTFTKCQENKVFEVDGISVLDYYRQFLGKEQSNDFFEKMVQRYCFSVLKGGKQKCSVLKLPGNCNFKDGSISFFPAENLQGEKAQLIHANRLGVIQGTNRAAKRCLEALDGYKPALVIVVTCCTRNSILHSKIDAELQEIQKVFGKDIPVFGYYSGGEIVPFLSRYEDIIDDKQTLSGSYYHATTISILAIGAKEPPLSPHIPFSNTDNEIQKETEINKLSSLLEKSEEILDNTEIFLSNLSRKSYQDSEQIRKQNEIIYRYTPHEVWNQIGENIAKGRYELEDAEFNGCYLFMDVKGFTAYSEEHGSKQVVSTLNEIFNPATEIIYQCKGDVDKFIGDCIFAVFQNAQDAVNAANKISQLFMEIKDKGNPFSVRIGINDGRAIRANVGGKNRREYTYIGDAVNLAQRLESNCTPGKLLLSENVFHAADFKFSQTERREFIVKGRKQKIVAYECQPFK